MVTPIALPDELANWSLSDYELENSSPSFHTYYTIATSWFAGEMA